MIGSDYVLEAHNIYHTTEVDTGGCFNGGAQSALVLKGVHLTVHSGEVMAILGSKGSGKRALLDVIARRSEGSSRGQVLLNGSPLTKSLFQQRCGYVTHSCDFIPGLTVAQTLNYTPTILGGYLKSSKVRQVLADLALSQVSHKKVENLNISEKRRLAIGVQLVRDPVMLLLDEPTQGLDPLSAYLLISILSNSAKKTGCGILLSMEKPRSDVFPFLDRALFLCLGGAVYSGGTRAMLEYFHGIGFPCPQLENPLMYYLCLSTVDRSKRAVKMIRRDLPTQSSASSTTNGSTLVISAMDDGTAPPPPPTVVRDFRSRSIDGPRRDSKERSSSSSNQSSSSSSSTIYMPVGVSQIKEEASDPDIHADSEVSLDANSTLAQVLEDFSNDEAGPHEPEIEIRTHSTRVLEEPPPFRKHHFNASQKALHLQMGNLAYQLTADQLFKPGPVNLLTKDMLEQKITEKDPDLVYRKHHNNNSTWARYMPMYYKGVKQNYVRCLECGWLVLHKASTGTGSLLRHKCKIKLPSGVEVKIEQQPPSNRNLPSKAATVGSTSSHTVKFQTTVMPQNVVDDLVRQQACFLYKDLSSVDLFDSSSFRTFAQMLVNIGVYYGQQDIAFLADRTRLMDQVLPTIYQQARIQLNQALVDCDLSYSFNMFRNEAENKSYATINSYTVAEDYYFRKINVKTVPVEDLESFIEGLPTIIIDMIEKEHNEPLKLVYGTKLDVRSSDDFELIPCVVTTLWGVMKKIMDMFKFDSEQYVEKIFLSEDDEEEDAMKKILAPFKEPIKSLVSDGNVTITEVVLWKKKLERHFRVEEADDENMKTIKEAFQMQIKQSLKLHEYHKIAVFLDPKFKGLRFLSEEERSETLAIVKAQLRRDQDGIEQLKKLYSCGKKNNVEIRKETKFYEFMDASLEVESADVVDDEIRQYVDVKLESPVDVLSYWRNENAFPLLKKLCQRVLNIPAACDDMKLRFGRAEQRDFLKKRAVLREEEIDMMLYLKQNGPSRDRFLESSQQIEALVERFARESPIPEAPINPIGSGKIPLAYGKPGELKVWGILYLRLLAATFSCGTAGMKAMFLRLLALPAAMGLMWLFYNEAADDSHGFFSKSGLILSVLGLSYGVGIWTTISLFPSWRKRFCQEYSEGMYTGATLLVAYNAVSMPFSFISSAVGACVLYPLVLNPVTPDGLIFMYILIALWSSFMLAEQLSIAFLLVVKSQINASIAVSYILIICLTLASGTVRSHKGLSPWLQENAKGVHTKYASSLLHSTIFHARPMDCTPGSGVVCPQPAEYLLERIGKARPQEMTDIAACIAFALGLCAFNMFLYLLPMPRCVRRKFRD